MTGETLDLSSGGVTGQAAVLPASRRRFIGVHFACCDVYTRIYTDREETAYTGCCPRCLKRVRIEVAPEGVDDRLFAAY